MKTTLTLIITLFVFAFGVESNAQTNNPNQDTIQAVKNELLGQWVRQDNNHTSKLVFKQDRTYKSIVDNEVVWKHHFQVALNCNSSEDTSILPGQKLEFRLLTMDGSGNVLGGIS